MPVPRNSLRGFLAHAKGALRAAVNSSQKITFVIGNESADLDSMTSSVLFAYIRSLAPPAGAFSPVYVPVTNIPFSGLAIRPEFQALFRHANIEPEHLITLDDLPDLSVITSKLRPENTRWILVDHNVLQGQLGEMYSERVGGVIDHHDDESKVPQDSGCEPRVIVKTGSCTSLVVDYCQHTWESLSNAGLDSGAAHGQGDNLLDDGAAVKLWDAQVAELGLASILIDTTNLQSADKTTEHDRKAVEYLEAKVMLCPQLSTGFNRSQFFMEIDSAKKDIGGLKLQDILRKDYKQWNEHGLKLGISSVVESITFMQKKAGDEAETQCLDETYMQALQSFSKDRELDLYAIMTTFTSSEGEFQRELLVLASNDSAVTAAKKFASHAQEELKLEDWHGPDSGDDEHDGNGYWKKVWWQRNVQHSRKRVAPLLREAMK